jgi:hypothetical protein
VKRHLPIVIASLAALAAACVLAGCTVAGEEDAGDATISDGAEDAADSTCEVLVVGGGLGGVAAAYEAASAGRRTCLTEEGGWLGGQLSAQGVPVDQLFTSTARSYQQVFDLVLDWYRERYPGAPTGWFNPGHCFRHTCAEPRVYAEVIEQDLLGPLTGVGLMIYKNVKPIEVLVEGDTVVGAVLQRADGSRLTLRAAITIDATELGDRAPRAGDAWRVGREGPAVLGEPSAPDDAGDPDCAQRFTYTFALERRPAGEDHRIPRPPDYDADRYGGAGAPLDIDAPYDPACQGHCSSWFTWRRYLSPANLPGAADVTSVNFFGANDFALEEAWCGPHGCDLLDEPDDVRAEILQHARDHALGYLYYIQNDTVPTYPNLALRPDVMGSTDGLSLQPYIREARRIRAITTVREQDLGRSYSDSLGIGVYGTDIKTCAAPHVDTSIAWGPARSVQIPLGALIPERIEGFLAGAKNLGVSHIANGVYRVHPIEWNIGVAAGAAAALAVERGLQPRALRADERLLRLLQQRIATRQGSPLVFFDDVAPTDPLFVAAQLAGTAGLFTGYADRTLRPENPLTRAQGAIVLVRAFAFAPVTECRPSFVDVPCDHFAYGPIQALADRGLVGGYQDGTFRPGNPFTRAQAAKVLVGGHCLGEPALCSGKVPPAGYDDVPADAWFHDVVARARAAGFFRAEVTGSIFDPNGTMTRRAMVFWSYNQMRRRLALP